MFVVVVAEKVTMFVVVVATQLGNFLSSIPIELDKRRDALRWVACNGKGERREREGGEKWMQCSWRFMPACIAVLGEASSVVAMLRG